MDWHEGYVSDIDYVAEFFPEQSPSLLSFACILNGVEPVALDRPFTYFELGSGQGLTANVLAAANPLGRFYAADFNPAHIAASRQLAESAELANVEFLESSFADLADGAVGLPQFDFVTLHGVYSWVNAENRRHIVRFLARYLKPGGIAYISYNAMPGWSTTLPLQRLILEHVDLYPGSRHQQIEHMRKLVGGLVQNKAAYFTNNAGAGLRTYLDAAMTGDADWSSYLAHEYMNRGWEPLYHADVVRDVAAAKLDYVGSAGLSWALPALYLTPAQSALLDTIADPALRETIKDYMKNTCFRKDVFVRGARRMGPERQRQWLEQSGIALTVLPEQLHAGLKFPAQGANPPAAYAPLLAALGQGPRTLLELARLPAMAPHTLAEIAEAAALLADTGQAAPYFLGAAGADTSPARRLNLAIAGQARGDDAAYRVFAAPLLGSGIKAPLFQRLVYRAVLPAVAAQALPLNVDAIATQVWRQVVEQGRAVMRDELELDSEDEIISGIWATVQAILERRSPLWRGLLMLPPPWHTEECEQ